MKLIPLKLGVNRPEPQKEEAKGKKGKRNRATQNGSVSIHRKPGQRASLPQNLRDQIMQRDDYTCQCCGFRSEKFQEIHRINQIRHDHRPENLVTTCIFCHQCFNLQDAANMRSGILIWLPEIEQKDLHNIMRAVYVARVAKGPVADAARAIFEKLKSRQSEAIKRINTDSPYIMATVMHDYIGNTQYRNRDKKLAGIRLLPLDSRLKNDTGVQYNQFPQILAYWRSSKGPFGGMTPPQWPDIYLDMVEKIAS